MCYCYYQPPPPPPKPPGLRNDPSDSQGVGTPVKPDVLENHNHDTVIFGGFQTDQCGDLSPEGSSHGSDDGTHDKTSNGSRSTSPPKWSSPAPLRNICDNGLPALNARPPSPFYYLASSNASEFSTASTYVGSLSSSLTFGPQSIDDSLTDSFARQKKALALNLEGRQSNESKQRQNEVHKRQLIATGPDKPSRGVTFLNRLFKNLRKLLNKPHKHKQA